MMLTVTTGVVALLASTIVAAGIPEAASSAAVPPMIVTVISSADMPPRLVAAVLAEADEIWRSAGVSFVWRRVAPITPAGD